MYLSIVGTHARRLNSRILKKKKGDGVMTLSLGIRFPLVLVIELAVCDAEGEPPVIDKRLGLDDWSFAQQ